VNRCTGSALPLLLSLKYVAPVRARLPLAAALRVIGLGARTWSWLQELCQRLFGSCPGHAWPGWGSGDWPYESLDWEGAHGGVVCGSVG
jgi:hypothetical protein